MDTTNLRVRIAERTSLTPEIAHFVLIDIDDRPLPSFEPGAHIELNLDNGLTRQYSLLNDPNEDNHHYEIAVLKDQQSRGGSIYVHDKLQVGTELNISTPRNLFPLKTAPQTLLFAGGIGITPLLAMAHSLRRNGKPFSLHIWNRCRDTAAFLNASANWPHKQHCHWHFDDEPDTHTDALELLKSASSDTHVYVCGPAGFMDHVIDGARSMNWSDDRIHYEYFGQAVGEQPGNGFLLQLARSQKEVFVSEDETVIEALERIGVDVPYSCEQGVCGTCTLNILEGEPDHRDLFLTDAERALNDRFTPCCSRARSDRLVVDL